MTHTQPIQQKAQCRAYMAYHTDALEAVAHWAPQRVSGGAL